MNKDNSRILKEKLLNYNAENFKGDWTRMEKDLDRLSFVRSVYRNVAIGGAAMVTALLTYFILSNAIFNNEQIIADKINNSTTEFENLSLKESKYESMTENHAIQDQTATDDRYDSYQTYAHTSTSTSVDTEHDSYEDEQIHEHTDHLREDDAIIADSHEVTEKDTDHDEKLSKFIPQLKTDGNCEPVNVTFYADKLPENYILIWHTGDGMIMTGKNVKAVYDEAGTYTPKVEVKFNDNIVKTIYLQKLEVKPGPTVQISYSDIDNYFSFSAITEAKNQVNSYLWEINNEVFLNESFSYEFRQQGTFNVKLTVINQFGCEAYDEISVSIKHQQEFYLPTAFIPSSGDVNSYFGPIGENLKFEYYQMTVSDKTGRIVFRTNDLDNSWNGRMFNSGAYLPEDVYFYEIIALDKFGNTTKKTGRVNLLMN